MRPTTRSSSTAWAGCCIAWASRQQALEYLRKAYTRAPRSGDRGAPGRGAVGRGRAQRGREDLARSDQENPGQRCPEQHHQALQAADGPCPAENLLRQDASPAGMRSQVSPQMRYSLLLSCDPRCPACRFLRCAASTISPRPPAPDRRSLLSFGPGVGEIRQPRRRAAKSTGSMTPGSDDSAAFDAVWPGRGAHRPARRPGEPYDVGSKGVPGEATSRP